MAGGYRAGPSAEQVVLGGHHERRGSCPRRAAGSRPGRARRAGRRSCPRASSAAEASSSATARTVVRMTRPSASGWPRRSSSGRIPDTPSATSTMPQRHGRPKLSETMTGRSVPKPGSERRPDPRRRGVGVDRQERHEVARVRPDVRGVDAAVRAHEPVMRLGDQHAALHPHDRGSPRAARPRSGGRRGPSVGPLDRLGRRLDRPQVDDGALRLGHHLLGDDEDVTGLRGERAGRRLERVADHRLEIVARVDLGQAGERDRPRPGRRRQSTCRRLGRGCLGEQQVLGRVDVEAERTSQTSVKAASADEASQAWPARESPPNAGSMTSGGSSSRAFVPLPWRSGTRTTDGGRSRRRPRARARRGPAATAGRSAGG